LSEKKKNTINLNPKTGPLFYRELEKTAALTDLPIADRNRALYELMELIFIEATRAERISFSTFFARMAYVCQKYDFDKQLQHWVHSFRKYGRRRSSKTWYQLGLHAIAFSIQKITGHPVPPTVEKWFDQGFRFDDTSPQTEAKIDKARVIALADDPERNQLIVNDSDCPHVPVRVQYNIAHRNENFNPTIRAIRKVFGFPVTLNLLDIEVSKSGIYRPRAIVVEPDYLVDISAIAECFKSSGTMPERYLLTKFLPFSPNKYTMIGHIANFFLDELLTNPDATFQEIFPKAFRLNPLAFATFGNHIMREIMGKAQLHFANLKQFVKQGMREVDLEKEACFLEPSFFAETYGIQGRLDVFYRTKNKSAIVELKSGSAYGANTYGISPNHYVQTLLYDLTIKSVFEHAHEPTNYILYSGVQGAERKLRYAPVVEALQYEAIQLRNMLVAYEQQLGQNPTPLLTGLRTARLPHLKGFIQKDLETFEAVYHKLSPLERAWFDAFAGFIAREHSLSKTGLHGNARANGLAGLWLNSIEEKDEQFEIAAYLTIADNQADQPEPVLTFSRTERTNKLANFRQGDIAILYPETGREQGVLRTQVFKGTITSITSETIQVRLRYAQFNTRIFETYEFWHLEHDTLDMSFTGMYRGLFRFAQSSERRKSLLLTTTPPRPPEELNIEPVQELTDEQNRILKNALSAQDYFLLWGPPGTGKTSKMLKHLVRWLMENTDENILVLAYTNRAVDEICASIESIATEAAEWYLRIGSRFSTGENYRARLLSQKLKSVSDRESLKKLLHKHRIFVSTVSSFSNKTELLALKQFNRVIIDEASQVLEPQLVGLLSDFERFILIGDHKQLPAVVVQDAHLSAVSDEALRALGLENLNNSLFERLYKRCRENKWTWAYDRLSHQGRMHADIMEFPNRLFYEGALRTLPESVPGAQRQNVPLQCGRFVPENSLESFIAGHRLVFIPTRADDRSATLKTNVHEARMAATVLSIIKKIYAANDKEIAGQTVGIITPYRAQIAQILKETRETDFPEDCLTVDTVERYQGGARDVIILSLCTNELRQMHTLVSLSDEGVDRKLNVALTRAREQIIILGNDKILKTNEIYRKLIESCAVWKA